MPVKAALLVTYGCPYPGREMKALELSAEVATFYGKSAAEGRCTEPVEFVSTGTGKGFWFVIGERDDLLAIEDTPEAKALQAKSLVALQSYTSEIVLAGDAVSEFYAKWAEALDTPG